MSKDKPWEDDPLVTPEKKESLFDQPWLGDELIEEEDEPWLDDEVVDEEPQVKFSVAKKLPTRKKEDYIKSILSLKESLPTIEYITDEVSDPSAPPPIPVTKEVENRIYAPTVSRLDKIRKFLTGFEPGEEVTTLELLGKGVSIAANTTLSYLGGRAFNADEFLLKAAGKIWPDLEISGNIQETLAKLDNRELSTLEKFAYPLARFSGEWKSISKIVGPSKISPNHAIRAIDEGWKFLLLEANRIGQDKLLGEDIDSVEASTRMLKQFGVGATFSLGLGLAGKVGKKMKKPFTILRNKWADEILAGALRTTVKKMRKMPVRTVKGLITKADKAGRLGEVEVNLAQKYITRRLAPTAGIIKRGVKQQKTILPTTQRIINRFTPPKPEALSDSARKVVSKFSAQEKPLTPDQMKRNHETIFDVLTTQIKGNVSRPWAQTTKTPSVANKNWRQFLQTSKEKVPLVKHKNIIQRVIDGKEEPKKALDLIDDYYRKVAKSRAKRALNKLDANKFSSMPAESKRTLREIFGGASFTKDHKVLNKLESLKLFNPYKTDSQNVLLRVPAKIFKKGQTFDDLDTDQLNTLARSLEWFKKSTTAEMRKYKNSIQKKATNFANTLLDDLKATHPGELPKGQRRFGSVTFGEKVKKFIVYPNRHPLNSAQMLFGYDSKATERFYNMASNMRETHSRSVLHSVETLRKIGKKYGVSQSDLLKEKVSITTKDGQKLTLRMGVALDLFNASRDYDMMKLFAAFKIPFIHRKLRYDITLRDIENLAKKIPERYKNYAFALQDDIASVGFREFNKTLRINTGQRLWKKPGFWPRSAGRDYAKMDKTELLRSLDDIGMDADDVGKILTKDTSNLGMTDKKAQFMNRLMLNDNTGISKARTDHNYPFIARDIVSRYLNYYNNLGNYAGKERFSHIMMLAFQDKRPNGLIDTVSRRMGASGSDNLKLLQEAVNHMHGVYYPAWFGEKALRKIVDYAHGTPLMMNLNVITNQPFSGIMSLEMFGLKAVAKSLTYSKAKRDQIVDKVLQQSPHLRQRFSRDWAHQVYSSIGERLPFEKYGMAPIRKADLFTVTRSSILPAYAEGELKGLTGKQLDLFAAKKAMRTVDRTAPTGDPFTMSKIQRAAKKSVFWKAATMFTSPIFKAWNFADEAAIAMSQGKMPVGKASARIATATVLIPTSIYIKGQLVNKMGKAAARAIGGKEGVMYEKEAEDMLDHIYGIGMNALTTLQPVAGITEEFVRNGYRHIRERRTYPPNGLSIDRGILWVWREAISTGYDFAKLLQTEEKYERGPYEGEQKALYKGYELIGDIFSVASPYTGALIRNALPSDEYVNSFYYTMLYDAMLQKDGPRASFAFNKLVRDRKVSPTSIYRRVKDKSEDNPSYDWGWLSEARQEHKGK